ncbi:MAG: efflux transporter outer membrane subunit [Myxococcales bacterium]|nr:efflux transporter outer membrane subunit [Myxococcales bacterium]
MLELRRAALLLAPLFMTACTLAPDYVRPEAPVSGAFPTAGDSGAVAGADVGWRDVFEDPRLVALETLALANNRDLRIAALNVEKVRAEYRIQRAPLFPSVAVSGSATFQELPSSLPSSQFVPLAQYGLSVGVTSWELDFFGRIRSLSAQALEQYLSTEEAARSAQLSLVAEVATAHFQERAAAEQLTLAEQTLEAVQASFQLTRRTFELGTVSELDLRTAESQLETARANVAAQTQAHAQAVNALVYLVGQPLPDDLPAPRPLAQATVRAALPSGLPSDLLQRRPDILAAEHQLMGANASIGAARAAFFPSISLTGAAGLASTDLASLFSGSALTWSFIPRINIPIFQGGALRASLEVAEVQKEVEIATYERTIQAAFREVADALAARQAVEGQLAAQRARVEAETQRYALAEKRYRAGVDRYLTLLTAQRDLYTAQQALIAAELARLSNTAALYRALGGGWREHTAEATPRAAPAG